MVISPVKPINLLLSNPYLLKTAKLKVNFNISYFLGFCNCCIGFWFSPVNTQYCCRGTFVCIFFNFSFCTTLLWKKKRKHLILKCGSLFVTNLKIEVERKVIVLRSSHVRCSIEKLLKIPKTLLLNLPVETTSEWVHF